MASEIDIEIAEPLQMEPSENIAETLTPLRRDEIANTVLRDYEVDETNFRSRKERIEKLYKLALQVADEKSYPWQNASNVKYPLITDAALAFSAMAYPSIVKDDKVVKCKINGSDEGDEPVLTTDGPLLDDAGEEVRKNQGLKQKISERVSTFMSYQILNDIDGWEEDMDKILLINAIVGCSFKKVYYDPLERKNVSRLVLPQYVTMDINARTEESAARITEILNLYPYEIDENIRLGTFREFDYATSSETKEDDYGDSARENALINVDDNLPHVFIEQHCRIDLDEDGYAEPYIVWLHKETKEIARIVPRFDDEDILRDDAGDIIKIKAQCHYIKFGFIPDPEGSPYDIGFGHILEDLNSSINTSINQMIDQGHRYTMGGGFIGDGLRIKSGETKFKPGEYKRVKTKGMSIRENVVNLPMSEPSATLMLLINALIESAKNISSMSKVMAGDMPANMPATTALASIEQGMQPFKAVFKRIHRSLKKEFKRLHYLNQQYLTQEEYMNVLDDKAANVERDFNTGAVDIIPLSDPEMLTNTQSFIKAQFLSTFLQDPYVDPVDLRERIFKAMNEKEIDDLVRVPPPQQPDMVAETQVALLETQMLDMKNRNVRDDKKFKLEIEKHIIDSKAKLAKATKDIADAEAAEEGAQLAQYQQALETEQFNLTKLTQMKKEMGNEPERMGQVEGAAGNGGVLPVSK